MKVKKRPIILEAWELVEDYESAEKPDWVEEALNSNKLFLSGAVWYADTTECTLSGKIGDILVQDIDEEIYICDRDIFNKTYDIVE